jgi:hypothetical protein
VEEQTNANAEELDTQSGEQTVLSSPDIQTEEAEKKSARTLKMKATEAGDKADLGRAHTRRRNRKQYSP